MNNVYIRSVEPADYLALQQLYAHPKVYRDTLQLPLPTQDIWAKKSLIPQQVYTTSSPVSTRKSSGSSPLKRCKEPDADMWPLSVLV